MTKMIWSLTALSFVLQQHLDAKQQTCVGEHAQDVSAGHVRPWVEVDEGDHPDDEADQFGQ